MAGPTVVLAVTGGIAAYKSPEILRRLQDAGVRVRVAMTAAATRFVGPTTFAALSGEPVVADVFDPASATEIPHVAWAESCDAFCVAPATADFIAKMALGLADDFPSTLYLAVTAPVVVAPAMEDDMYAHAAVQDNLDALRRRGVRLVGPGIGALASGRTGPGRMAEPDEVVEAVLESLGPASRPGGGVRVDAASTGTAAADASGLRGLRVLVSAGPTREHIDPVRVITNPSSGKMGHAVAAEAARRGAIVTLVSGPSALRPPAGVETVGVETAEEMAEAMLRRAPDADVVVMAAAVSDYRPRSSAGDKIKKAGAETLTLELVRNPDILQQLGKLPGPRTLVGFAAETSDLERHGRDKLERKGCDLVVANQVGPGVGFESDDNAVVILDRHGGREEHGPAPKARIAGAIWDRVVRFRDRQAGRPDGTGDEGVEAATGGRASSVAREGEGE